DHVRQQVDDIIVFGVSQDEHGTRLASLLQRNGLRLNKQKCKFNRDSLEFDGHILSSKGIPADPRKTEVMSNTYTVIPAAIS
ncbi:Hypothetical predicted protein, partial [Mytilus galloprovincialis]